MAVDTGASSEGWHGAGRSWNFALQMVSLFITGTINLQRFTSTPTRCSLIYMRLLLAGPFVLVKRWQWQCGWRMVNGEWRIRRRFVNSASKCLHAAQIFINIVYDRAYFIFSSTPRLFAACCHIHMHSVCVYFYHDEQPRLIRVARDSCCSWETYRTEPDNAKRDWIFTA